MPGGDLASFISEARSAQEGLAWVWRLRCALDIAEAAEYLHELGYVHRDLKSLNVLLDESGERCKVADFGTSRPLVCHFLIDPVPF